jgi:hypothetical protein
MPPMEKLFSMSRPVTFFFGDECAGVAMQFASIVKAAVDDRMRVPFSKIEAGRFTIGELSLLPKPNRQPLGAAVGLPYARTSRSGPVPASNFAAILSLRLKRSHGTPETFSSVE